jgi:zinc transporter 1/2/3
VLQGLAAGTLIYVVFFEIIEKERNKGTNGLLQVSIMLRNRGRFFSQSSS